MIHRETYTKAKLVAKEKRKGKTYLEISELLGVGPERCRQLIQIFFYDEVFPKKKHKFRIPPVELKCRTCGKKLKLSPAVAKTIRSCNQKCADIYAKKKAERRYKLGLFTRSKHLTEEKVKELNNIRSKAYYHAHKHEPVFKARVKKNNDAYAERAKQRYHDKKRTAETNRSTRKNRKTQKNNKT